MIISRTCIEHKQNKRRCPIFTIDSLDTFVVTGSYNGEVIIWRIDDSSGSNHGRRPVLPSFTVLQKIYDHKSSVLNARFYGEYLITTGDDNLCILYKQIRYGNEGGARDGERIENEAAKMSEPAGNDTGSNGAQQVNDTLPILEYKKLQVIAHHKADITSLHIKDDSFLTAGLDGLIYVYDFTGSLLNYVDIRTPIKGLYTKDNRTFVKTDTHLLIYEDKTLVSRIVCDGILNESFFARMTSFGKFMVVPSMFNNREDVVMLVSDEEILSLVGFVAPVEVVYVLGNILICGCQDKSVVLWRHEHNYKLRENLYEDEEETAKRAKIDGSKEESVEKSMKDKLPVSNTADEDKRTLVCVQNAVEYSGAGKALNNAEEGKGKDPCGTIDIVAQNEADEKSNGVKPVETEHGTVDKGNVGKGIGVKSVDSIVKHKGNNVKEKEDVLKDNADENIVKEKEDVLKDNADESIVKDKDNNVKEKEDVLKDNNVNNEEKKEENGKNEKQNVNVSAKGSVSKGGSPKGTVTVNKIRQGSYTRPLCLIKNLTTSPILDITTYKKNVLFCSYSGEVVMVTFDKEQIDEIKQEEKADVNIGKELLSITDQRISAFMKSSPKDGIDDTSSSKCDNEFFKIRSDIERKRGRPKMCRTVEMEQVVLDESMMIGKRKVLCQNVGVDSNADVSNATSKKATVKELTNQTDGTAPQPKDSVVKMEQPTSGTQRDKPKRRITPVLIPQLTNYEDKIVSVKNSVYVLFKGNEDYKVMRECIRPVLMKMKEITVRVSCGGSVEQIDGQKVCGDVITRRVEQIDGQKVCGDVITRHVEQIDGQKVCGDPNLTNNAQHDGHSSFNNNEKKEKKGRAGLYTIDVCINDVLRYTLRYRNVRLLAFSHKYIAIHTNVLIVKNVISGQLLLPFIKQNVLYVDIKGDNLLLFMGDTFKIINLRKKKLLVAGSVPFDTYNLCFSKEYFVLGCDLKGNKYFFMKEIGEWCRVNHEESEGFGIVAEKSKERAGLSNEDGDGIIHEMSATANNTGSNAMVDKNVLHVNSPTNNLSIANESESAVTVDNIAISQLFDNDDLSSLELIEYSILKKQSSTRVLSRLRLFISNLRSMTEVIEIRLENIFMNLVMNECRLDVIGILEEMKCTFPVFVYDVLGKIAYLDKE
ncbi:Histone transcription regulator HIRA, WD repeat superfamily [Trachipleistophora hominis]|uniref:Histone transcription regulator HIRA, WD repeat superfamily n=1 Tax=Trachipleistophora hominis TaxID=72359 RepID=L7JSF2_TRAHO|nr:Histone transcription regulator HIRA, WD repeat superfamily [Trachipleistophora hominis]